jgi:hypothetical protein
VPIAGAHGDSKGNPVLFEEDWVNLEQPELSCILRAPGAPEGYGSGSVGIGR